MSVNNISTGKTTARKRGKLSALERTLTLLNGCRVYNTVCDEQFVGGQWRLFVTDNVDDDFDGNRIWRSNGALFYHSV